MTVTSPPRFLRLPEVCARTGLARDSIYRLAKLDPRLRPVKLAARASGWNSHSIDAWVAERIAASRGGK